ncbi:hypothetical protein [Pseudomonas chlororaphis]|uniref:Uncharacterized protein n=1 Tax=Pseudomonas chlororaphis TaxID=587753 RepID=A0A1Q8ERM9_9PSED|nr:hypothetical protein [Pseudomonas chlororaphis]OLF54462.1 hypothetical protein BTN82_10665 [Pseudomonas chlororaphis]
MRLINCLFLVLLTGLASLQATAGPSFNSDREALAKGSDLAGAELHRGFQAFHEMLMYLELGETDNANKSKALALQHFNESVVLFKKVSAEAPEQKIVYQPSTNEEKDVIGAFQGRLKELGLAEPATEKQLAELAVTAITRHIQVLEKSSFKRSKADYPVLRKALRSQALLLDLGILTSIVWTLSVDQPST